MTLSQFLRDYLYIPLGGNRRGRGAALCQSVITMLLGGLWHGAAWTFVVWGALHGALSLHQSRLEQVRAQGAAALRAAGRYRRIHADISGRRRRLGVLPRRQPAGRAHRAVEDGRSLQYRLRPRSKSRKPLFIAIYAAHRLVRAEHAGPSWATITQNRTVGRGASRLADAARCSIYATAAVLAFGILGIQQHSEFIYFRF